MENQIDMSRYNRLVISILVVVITISYIYAVQPNPWRPDPEVEEITAQDEQHRIVQLPENRLIGEVRALRIAVERIADVMEAREFRERRR